MSSSSSSINMAAIAAQGGTAGAQCYTRIWIGGLPRNSNVDEVRSELKRVFGEFGVVLDICVITTAKDVMAFVQYENEQDAMRARETMNGSTVLGSVVKVNYAVIRGADVQPKHRATSRSRSRERHKYRLSKLNFTCIILENIPSDTTSEELADFATQAINSKHSTNYGGVSFVNLFKDNRKTFGIVTYETPDLARKGKEYLEGCKIDGRRVHAMTIAEFNDIKLQQDKNY
jgi:RNA recognition motif-containing protein